MMNWSCPMREQSRPSISTFSLGRRGRAITCGTARGRAAAVIVWAVVGLWALVGQSAGAQPAGCRQAWMPKDAPAFCGWQPEPSLPEARTYLAIATRDRVVYVLGGYRFDASTGQVVYYDSVVRASIGADGHLSAWAAEPSFAGARSGAAAVAVGDCVFLSGGSASTPTSLQYYGDLQAAQIGADGGLSAWTTSPNHLVTPRSNHSLVALTTDQGTFLEAVAGVTQIGADTVHLDTIETAKIETDCKVGPWRQGAYHLKGGRSSPQALALRNEIAVIGGWGDLDLTDVYNDVQTTSPRADGSVGPWRSAATHLPSGIYGHATAAAAPASLTGQALLLSVGGQPGTGAYANWISFAYVTAGGPLADRIGPWRIAPTGKLPVGRAGLGTLLFGDRLYVIGGADAAGRYYGDAASVEFDVGQP
jgi:hypothetical protein